jgi:hypothetical protein
MRASRRTSRWSRRQLLRRGQYHHDGGHHRRSAPTTARGRLGFTGAGMDDETTRVTSHQDRFEAEFADPLGPTHWPSLLPDEAGQAWTDLRDWVEALVDRFALETRVVPPCWYRHNTAVEALSALRDHERICYAPSASPTAAVDWFRGLREIEHRLNQACARTQCSVNEHRPDPPRTWQTDQDQWQDFVAADVRDRERKVIDESLAGG